MTKECAISFEKPCCVEVTTSDKTFKVEVFDDVESWLNDSRMTVNGQTVGQLNQKWLYDKFQAWLRGFRDS